MKQAELAKEKAAAKVAETQGQVQAAKLQAQARTEAAERASAEAKAAEAARDAAVEQAEEATRKTSPVSVFISRKTQRLYIRQGYQPVFEAPITIRDADKPIGSYVFTALSYVNSADVRWSVVSMYKGPDGAAPPPPAKHGRARLAREAALADVAGAKAALDRIVHPSRCAGAHLARRAAGLLSHHLRRKRQHRDRQGYRFRRADERRAARRDQDAPPRAPLPQRRLLRRSAVRRLPHVLELTLRSGGSRRSSVPISLFGLGGHARPSAIIVDQRLKQRLDNFPFQGISKSSTLVCLTLVGRRTSVPRWHPALWSSFPISLPPSRSATPAPRSPPISVLVSCGSSSNTYATHAMPRAKVPRTCALGSNSSIWSVPPRSSMARHSSQMLLHLVL